MTLRLRPHHLLCILTYSGKGYSADFIINFSTVIKRIQAGETIQIVSGPDDICTPMLGEPKCHCNNPSVLIRDQRAIEDLARFVDLELSDGTILELSTDQIRQLQQQFANKQIRSACSGCEWFEFCSDIATDHFTSSQFQTPQ